MGRERLGVVLCQVVIRNAEQSRARSHPRARSHRRIRSQDGSLQFRKMNRWNGGFRNRRPEVLSE